MRISDWSSDVCSSDLSSPVAPITAATTGQPASSPLARAAETACAAKPCPIVRIVTKPSISGVYRHEPVSQHLLVIENRLARIFRLPRATGVVGVVGIAAAERFVAVARWIKEVNCLAPRDAMTRRADVERNIVATYDVSRVSNIVPRQDARRCGHECVRTRIYRRAEEN